MQLLEKYGKNYCDAPLSKNIARTIVMRLQVKIWQEPLLAIVYHCLQKRDAQNKLFRMPPPLNPVELRERHVPYVLTLTLLTPETWRTSPE